MSSGTGNQTDPSGLETLELFSDTPAFNRWLFERIAPFCQGPVLEIGSGIGNISRFLLDSHINVSLSDLRPEYCHYLENKFANQGTLQGVYQMDLSLPDFEYRFSKLLHHFDTVIALNVVEHIEQEDLAIQNGKKLLRENGNLIVLVPAGQCLYNSFDRELGHYRRYSKTSLSRLLGRAGLTVIQSNYFNFGGILGWWLSGTVLKKKIIPSSQLKLFNQLVPVFRMVDRVLSNAAGLSVIAVAKNQSS